MVHAQQQLSVSAVLYHDQLQNNWHNRWPENKSAPARDDRKNTKLWVSTCCIESFLRNLKRKKNCTRAQRLELAQQKRNKWHGTFFGLFFWRPFFWIKKKKTRKQVDNDVGRVFVWKKSSKWAPSFVVAYAFCCYSRHVGQILIDHRIYRPHPRLDEKQQRRTRKTLCRRKF